MPGNKEFKRTCAIYDQMSTEALNNILNLAAQPEDNGVLDSDSIAYIAGVIAKREKEAHSQELPDLRAAWETFQREYLPCPGIGATLYDFDGEKSNIQNNSEPKANKRHFAIVGRIAAVLAVVLVAGSITAHAFNTSLRKVVVQWFDSFYTLVVLGETEPETTVRPDIPNTTYVMLSDALEAYHITTPLASTWIPDGYWPDGVNVIDTEKKISFTAYYKNANQDRIIITVTTSQQSDILTLEKGIGEVDTYEFNNIDHYIAPNNSNLMAVWINESYKCKIIGPISRANLERMIQSIYA